MKLQSSYIFLKKEHEREHEREHKREKNGVDNSKNEIFVLRREQKISNYIMDLFPGATNEKPNNKLFKDKITYDMQVADDIYHVNFDISEVIDTTYLNIFVEGKSKVKIIGCLEQIQDKLFSLSELKKKYLAVTSYDAISEYYCNQIIPELNSFERNLRRLLFNTYIVNFGRKYYKATTDKNFRKKIDRVIHPEGNEEEKEEKRLKQFFHSFTFADIQTLLFKSKGPSFDEEAKKKFLDEHQDLSSLPDDQLRKAFLDFSIKSDWDRFFSDKINIDKIQEKINNIRISRNKIAHFKFFSKQDYNHCKKNIKRLNKAIIKAIQITEEKDFASKNYEYMDKMLTELLEIVEKIAQDTTTILEDKVDILACDLE